MNGALSPAVKAQIGIARAAFAKSQPADVKAAKEAKAIWTPNPGPQTDFMACNAFEALYGGSVGGGKALPLDTPIATPSGWSTMGALSVGDLVFDDTGNPSRVLTCSPVMTEHVCYELTFSDGARIVADAEHLWVTRTLAEKSADYRRDPGFRAARRAARPSRGIGKRPDMAAVNSARSYVPKVAAPPSIRTTQEIVDTLALKGRINHEVAVAGALVLPDAALPIDPYVLGAWLGDGTSVFGSIASNDAEIVDAIRAAGFEMTKYKAPFMWGIRGLQRLLRVNGLLGNKHIPLAYLRASEAQRLALLQGLMDTDGYADSRGQCEFTTTRQELRDGALELILSLGIKAVATEGRAKLHGKDMGPKWRIKFLTEKPVFRLTRKLVKQKRDGFRGTHNVRYIVAAREVPSVPVKCIGVDAPSRMYLAGREMIPTHNTYALVHDALRDIDKPSYQAILFRNSFPEMEKTLLEESRRTYPKLGAEYDIAKKVWRFPSGAKVYFGYLEGDNDVYQYQGAEFQYVGFDELTKFTLKQYTYLMSRLRSSRGVRSRIRASTNPGGKGHGWVMARWLPWIDKKHALHAAPAQVLNYVASPNGDVYTETGKLSRTFIPAKLADNPKLLENDPDYVERLGALDPVTRAQLLDGRWDVVAAAGLYFKRGWVTFVDAAPQGAPRARGWDKAATEPSARNPDPDWTRGVRMSFANDRYYIEDLVSLRGDPGAVKSLLRSTAELDGKATAQRIPQDPGAAGKSQAAEDVRSLDGFIVRTQTVTGDKVTRFGPFSGQASPQSTGGEHGRVCIVRGPWNEELVQELEAFPDGDHDDIVDALSDAYDELQTMSLGNAAPPPEVVPYDPDCAPVW